MMRALKFVFYTEMLLGLRRSQEWLYPLGFFVIVMSLFPLAFSPDPVFLQKYVPGCVWIAALFASLLSIENIFHTELEDGHLEQLLLSEIPLSFLITTKLLAKWLVTEMPLILLTPLIGILFHLSAFSIFILMISLLLGTPILTLIMSLGVALTLGLQNAGVLLGLLILPLTTPVLIFGVNIVQQSQAGLDIVAPCAFLAGLCVFAITLIPWAIAEAVRVGVED